MRHPPDDRLWELLLRYMDNALSEHDSRELDQRLLVDPGAREAFQEFCEQARALTKFLRPAPECRPAHPLDAVDLTSRPSAAGPVQHG
jgi:hypothetical protein